MGKLTELLQKITYEVSNSEGCISRDLLENYIGLIKNNIELCIFYYYYYDRNLNLYQDKYKFIHQGIKDLQISRIDFDERKLHYDRELSSELDICIYKLVNKGNCFIIGSFSELNLEEMKEVECLLLLLNLICCKKDNENLFALKSSLDSYFYENHVGNAIIDLEGNYISVNNFFENLLGYSEAELQGMKNLQITHPDDVGKNKLLMQQLIDGEIKSYRHDKRVIRKNGEIIWIDISVIPIFSNDRKIKYLMGTAVDITERKKTEEIIQGIIIETNSKTGQELFNAMVENLAGALNADCVLIGEIDTENEEIINTLAMWRNGTLTNNKIFPLKGNIFEEILYTGVAHEITKIIKSEDMFFFDGMEISTYIGMPLIDMQMRAIGILGVFFRDTIKHITFMENILLLFVDRTARELERIRVEREREKLLRQIELKNIELEQIVYVTSHDLRSPLVNIQGFTAELNSGVTELLEKIKGCIPDEDINRIINEDIKESLYFIKVSINKMDMLLNGLLRLSRLGRAALKFEEQDMNILFEDVLKTFEFKIKEEKISVEVEKLPVAVCDKIQVGQVVSNLVDNAIKYRKPDIDLRIKVSGKKTKEKNIFCVEDNGIGIDSTRIDKIFELFYRVDSSAGDGLGLGMTIVKKLLEKMNGEIWVESQLGIGSKFYFSLPNRRYE